LTKEEAAGNETESELLSILEGNGLHVTGEREVADAVTPAAEEGTQVEGEQ